MKYVSILIALVAAATAARAEEGVLTVTVDGARSADGVVRIAVCADDDCYQNNGPFIAKANKPASLEPLEFTFSGLETGEYAVVLHHDEDDDGEFDRFFLAPVEGYGFSNNVKPRFGRPPFYAVAVELTDAGATAPITIQY